MRPWHPLAVAAFSRWFASLPVEVQEDGPFTVGETTAAAIVELFQRDGDTLADAVRWVCSKGAGGGRAWWYPPVDFPAYVRELRADALREIAEHEPSDEEVVDAEVRRERVCRENAPFVNGLRACLCFGDGGPRAALRRRRRAAARLLAMDMRADDAAHPTFAFDLLVGLRG